MSVRRPALGVALMIGAGLAWSTGGLFVRSVSITDGWEIVFWRSLFMVPCLATALAVFNRGDVVGPVRSVGRAGWLAGALLTVQFFSFLLAVTRTTVAETLVIMSMSPFVAALFGWALLREPVRRRTWVAMAVGVSGITVMFAGALGTGAAIGNLIALGVPLAFAAQVVVLRRYGGEIDMLPTVMIAGMISVVLALPLAWPLEASARDIVVLAFMGAFQLALGCALMTIAVRHLAAAEIGVFALLETILGPIWVWIGIGEQPSNLALLGAGIVVGALAVNAALGARERT
jgi:drug/metabolite transporter (DMT)-like permease